MSESDYNEQSSQLTIEELLSTGDWSLVESKCTEAIKVDSHKVFLFVSRGTARYHQQKFAEAIEDYEIAIERDPLNRTASFGRARALLNNKHIDEAEAIVRNALDNNFGDREALELFK